MVRLSAPHTVKYGHFLRNLQIGESPLNYLFYEMAKDQNCQFY